MKINGPRGYLDLSQCRVMGILNVTPDSFSDGGLYFNSETAVKRAWEIQREGAEVLDIGAESTRPGAKALDANEEWSRLHPVLMRLKQENYPLPISLDTSKAEIAERAVQSDFVHIINDVEGLRDPRMVEVVAKYKIPVVLMHMFGNPRTMQLDFHYEDVVNDIKDFFLQRLNETGVREHVILDPGIGFGKSVDHNLQLIRRLAEFSDLGRPILIGASRKSFIGKILNVETQDRLEGSLAAAAIAAWNGAAIVRVHDVQSTARVVSMVKAIQGKTCHRAEI